ncbi:MAG: enoyl-CoA hydratase/isomerase family protein [Acidimicrobiales bacterium]
MAEGRNDTVLVERQDAVATITLHRPDRGNGLDRQLRSALRDSLEAVAGDDTVRAVVLTGAGRSFCVGQDLAQHAETLRADAGGAFDSVATDYNPITTALATMPKPVVAAVNGACVGAGLGFVLACDLRISAEGAKFATAFTGIGLTADSGLSASLGRTVGAGRASELLLLGEAFTAEQALAWGVVGRVVAAEDLAGEAAALAARLATGPTRAYAELKAAMANAWGASLGDVLAAEGEGQARLGVTEDHRGAVEAFLAKEKPTFRGR